MPDRQPGSAGSSGAPLRETGQRTEPEVEYEPGKETLQATAADREPQPLSEFDAGLETGPEQETETGTGRSKVAAGIARGALIIAVLTTCSRILGLLRTVVFAQTVGSGCLGTAYVTANQVPNLIYELAIGGALTSAMVPVLARSAARSSDDPAAKQHVEQVSSALLTWSVVILLPLTAIIAATARPIAELLNPVNPNAACPRGDMIDATTNMLVVFAPQILLYGFSVVLFGLLQAYRRFTGFSLAPVLANVVTITSFLVFASLDHNATLARTPLSAELVLAVGTTLNIGMLVIVAIPPTWRLRLRLRPTLVFPPGVLSKAGGFALVGLLEFLAGDIYSVITIALANGHGDTGALVLVNYETLVFSSVCSVLPIAIVTSVFPVLSAADGDAFDRTCAGSARAVVLMSWLGAAVIAAVAVPAAHILAKEPGQVTQLTQGMLLCAPGVFGYAVIVNMSRVLFALGKLKIAGVGLVAGPLLQAVLSVPLVLLAPPRLVVAALALAGSTGMVAVAIPMVIATRRLRGRAALAGVGHATAAGLAAGAAGAAAGLAVTLLAPDGGKIAQAGNGVLAAALAVLVFGLVAYALDRGDLRAVAGRARRLARSLR
ncbi:murein biosynthesis integral membrane protein MurJ [Trebonia kvetii]|nr:lipid II flippase MurJ [Trebonia kvetii]